MNQEATFNEAVAGLLAGDFTRLAPLFDAEEQSSCPIIRWFDEKRFSREPKALAEAFTCACFNGRSRVIRYLLERGVDPCGGSGTGLNAFHWAANRGHKEAAEILIQSGAPLEIPNAYGGTVLGSAVWAAVHESKPDHLAIIQSLLEAGARVDGADFPSGSDQVDALLHRYRARHHPNA
jgi:hypothetical protein